MGKSSRDIFFSALCVMKYSSLTLSMSTESKPSQTRLSDPTPKIHDRGGPCETSACATLVLTASKPCFFQFMLGAGGDVIQPHELSSNHSKS